VEEFERGTRQPTFRQLALMAAKLDRPLGFFFASAPETPDVPETADFRGGSADEVPSTLAREMKRAEQHRDTMLDLAGPPQAPLALDLITWETAAPRAAAVRERLGLNEKFTPPESQQNQVFNFWRGLLEQHGVLVFQATRIPLEVFRGLSIHHDVLPLVLINGADSASAKVFTLFHELAHLANRTSGLCALNDNINEEALANAFAANFLMPENAVRQSLRDGDDPADASVRLAGLFKVSILAAAVRLRTLNVINDDDLVAIRAESDATWTRVREEQRNSDGFVPAWRLRYRDLGPTYIGAVARALDDGRIDPLDATYLLNARLPMVEQLLDEYQRTGGDG
jgi:Zn-dependent peptidase ImmA (M78 family)